MAHCYSHLRGGKTTVSLTALKNVSSLRRMGSLTVQTTSGLSKTLIINQLPQVTKNFDITVSFSVPIFNRLPVETTIKYSVRDSDILTATLRTESLNNSYSVTASMPSFTGIIGTFVINNLDIEVFGTDLNRGGFSCDVSIGKTTLGAPLKPTSSEVSLLLGAAYLTLEVNEDISVLQNVPGQGLKIVVYNTVS